MPFGLPARDEANWDTKLNDSINAIKATADAAQPSATLDASVTAVDANAASALRVQQDARLSATIVADRSSRTDHAPAFGLYFPEAEGAVGDGVANDTAALNAASAAAAAAGGGTVLLKPVTYSVTKIDSANKVILQGAGWGTVLKLRSTTTEGVVTIGSHDGFTVRDLKIDGDRLNVTGDTFGILKPATAAATNVRIERVWVTGARYIGIGILGPADRSVLSENITIDGCLTTDTGGHGIIVQNATDNAVVNGCTVETFGRVTSNTPGITVGRNCYDAKVTNNTIDGAGAAGASPHGISIDTTLSASVCTGNTVKNAVGMGIEIGYCSGTVVADNVVTGSQNIGISITGSASDAAVNALGYSNVPVDMTITGNVVRGGANIGIGVLVTPTQADLATAAWKVWGQSTAYSLADRIVFGGRLYEVTTAGTTGATAPATLGETQRTATVTDNTLTWTDRGPIINGVVITGNVVSDNAFSGIELHYTYNFSVTNNVAERNGRSGVYVASTSNIGTIAGNTLSGNCITDVTGSHANLRVLTVAASKQHRIKLGANLITSHSASLAVIATEGAANITGRFAASDTSPSVAFGDSFYTQNTVATTITTFDDAMADGTGRVIAVRIADANTTLQHGASTLDLSGDVNYSPPTGTHMVFAYVAGVWREVSRSAA